MWIVLDSTEFRRARVDLADADLQALFAARRGLDVRLAIPEVVLREVLNAIREESAAAAARADREIQAYASWTKAEVSLLASRLDADVETAQERFRKELRENDVRVLPLPELSHADLLSRDLARRKPFNQGKGYRDALIWHSVLALAEEEPVPVVLVTANKHDFGSGSLDPHLATDLAQRKWAPTRIVLAHSARECWDAFLAQRTQPLLDAVGAPLEKFLDARQVARLQKRVADEPLVFMGVRERSPILDRYRERGVRISILGTLPDPRFGPIRSATRFPDGTVLLSCHGTFRAVASHLTRKRSEPGTLREVGRELGGTFSARIVIPPEGAPAHIKADTFQVTTDEDLSPEARAWIDRLSEEHADEPGFPDWDDEGVDIED